MDNRLKVKRDIILYAILLIASTVFYKFIIPAQIYMSSAAKAEAFSPDTFPNAITAAFITFSALGLINEIFTYIKIRKTDPESAKEKNSFDKEKFKENMIPFAVFTLTLLYVVLFKAIGFIPSTLIIPPIILFVIGCRKISYYGILYVFAALMYCIFKFILSVPLH